jgi:hypothetical protein
MTNKNIIIVEGIPGAGKDTVIKHLKGKYSHKLIYDYSEGDLLFNWNHFWINDIDSIRLYFMEQFLNYCETIIQHNSNAVFVLNRFHLSYAVFTLLSDKKSQERYTAIVEKLLHLSSCVYIAVLDEQLIESRSTHIERVDPLWKIHLQNRLARSGFSTLRELYSSDQRKIISLAQAQGLPFELTQIGLN